MLYSLRDLFDMAVRGTDDEAGAVHDAYVDDDTWRIRYLVVETGSWLFGRRVLIAPEAVTGLDWDEKVLRVNLTRQQIEDAPDVDLERPVSRQQMQEMNAYYGWPAYWAGGPAAGTTPVGGYPVAIAPMAVRSGERREPEPVAAARREGNPDLRSAREVLGYAVQAQDDAAGEVDDLLLDEGWGVRYLVVDTGRLLPGKKVLMAPSWTERISWVERQVMVDMNADTVRDSPEFDPESPLDRDDELRLHEYYGRIGYWARDAEGERRR